MVTWVVVSMSGVPNPHSHRHCDWYDRYCDLIGHDDDDPVMKTANTAIIRFYCTRPNPSFRHSWSDRCHRHHPWIWLVRRRRRRHDRRLSWMFPIPYTHPIWSVWFSLEKMTQILCRLILLVVVVVCTNRRIAIPTKRRRWKPGRIFQNRNDRKVVRSQHWLPPK